MSVEIIQQSHSILENTIEEGFTLSDNIEKALEKKCNISEFFNQIKDYLDRFYEQQHHLDFFSEERSEQLKKYWEHVKNTQEKSLEEEQLKHHFYLHLAHFLHYLLEVAQKLAQLQKKLKEQEDSQRQQTQAIEQLSQEQQQLEHQLEELLSQREAKRRLWEAQHLLLAHPKNEILSWPIFQPKLHYKN